MDVVPELVARDRRSDDPALRMAATGRVYDYRRFCTTVWKTSNFFRLLGVREGAVVAIDDEPAPETLFAGLGAAMLGATMRFDAPASELDPRLVVARTSRVSEYDVGPQTKRVGHGSEPEDPAIGYFERDVWSENPSTPPTTTTPDDRLLGVGEAGYTNAELLGAARRLAERLGLEPGDEVAIRASLDHPGVVAGLLAPLVAGAAILLPGPDSEGTVAIGEGGPERAIDPATILPAP